MSIFTSEKELQTYLQENHDGVSYPILIDAYYPGKELEVDVVTDGTNIYIPGIFEHVEKAGVHSGDSIAITPPYDVSTHVKNRIVAYAEKIAQQLDFTGLFNIQFVLSADTLYVLEINPRASRTVPIFAKVSGSNLIEQSVQLLLGEDWSEVFGETRGLAVETSYYAVKSPVFSTEKLPGLDPLVGANMKSTGELLSFGATKEEAMKQVFAWKDEKVPAIYEGPGSIYCHIAPDQEMACQSALEKLKDAGFTLYGVGESEGPPFAEWVEQEDALLYISIPSAGSQTYEAERLAAERGRKMIVTAPETLNELVTAHGHSHQIRSREAWKETDLQRT